MAGVYSPWRRRMIIFKIASYITRVYFISRVREKPPKAIGDDKIKTKTTLLLYRPSSVSLSLTLILSLFLSRATAVRVIYTYLLLLGRFVN